MDYILAGYTHLLYFCIVCTLSTILSFIRVFFKLDFIFCHIAHFSFVPLIRVHRESYYSVITRCDNSGMTFFSELPKIHSFS